MSSARIFSSTPVDAAPGPSIAGPPAPRPPPANEDPLQPASQEVISNLLASLPSSATAEDLETSHHTGLPFQGARSLSRSSRRSLNALPQHSADSTDPTARFEEYHHPEETETLAADDAAEPPSIRTARPPSGRSRHTPLSKPRRQGPAAPSPPVSGPQSRASSRASMTRSSVDGDAKSGKSRIAGSGPISARGLTSASRKDSLQSLKRAQASGVEDDGGDALGISHTIHAFGRDEPGPSRGREGYGGYMNGERATSGRSSPVTSTPRLMSLRTGQYQPEQSGIQEQDEELMPSDPEENADTLRRIRELKARKEERLKSSTDPNGNPSEVGATESTTNSRSATPSAGGNVVRSKDTRAGTKEAPNISDKALPSLPNKYGFFPRGSPQATIIRSESATRAMSFDVVRNNGQSPSPKTWQGRWSQPEIPAGSHRKSLSIGGNSSRANAENQPPIDEIEEKVEEFIYAPRLSQKIPLPEDRRIVSFSEVGDPNGHPVFCCVGMGMTRFVTAFYDELATTLKLRLITPDRPGIGDSNIGPFGSVAPLRWPDDITAICTQLNIEEFSLMAHSAGAIYALATALRLPHQIRGKIHLLAPWIPPSQMSAIGLSKTQPPPSGSLPRSQRFLRILPTSFLSVANSSWMGTTSSSLFGSKAPAARAKDPLLSRPSTSQGFNARRGYSLDSHRAPPTPRPEDFTADLAIDAAMHAAALRATTTSALSTLDPKEIQRRYDQRLTPVIWDLATRKGNPSVDLIVCLERNQPIGFRYADITRAVVIHHGNKDSRVPIGNVRWLGKTMRKTEVRELEGEGHGLMASAGVMGSVLAEMSRELEG